jgi:alanine dehydrogenase
MGLPEVTTLIGFAGGLAVLASFAGVAFGRLSARSATYHAMNLAGGLALVVAGVPADAWPSVAVNGSWALISAHGLSRAVKRPPPRPELLRG